MQSFDRFRWTRHLAIAVALSALVSLVPAATIHEAGEPGLEPPRILPETYNQPPYPEGAGGKVQGTVLLRIVVDADGLVSDVEVFRAPFGGEALSRAASEAARSWRYQPARLDGEAVACRIMAPVSFYPPVADRSRTRASQRKNPRSNPVPPAPTPDPDPAPRQPPSGRGKVAPAPEPTSKLPAPVVRVTPEVLPPAPRSAAEPVPAPVTPMPSQRQVAPDPAGRLPGASDGLALGQDAKKAKELLPRLSAIGDGVLQSLTDGVEITLGEQVVTAIRYVFEDRAGFSSSSYRTPKGLGRGSFCVGIIPAYGRPDRRQTTGDLQELVYEQRAERTVFRCRAGRLVELSLSRESVDAPATPR